MELPPVPQLGNSFSEVLGWLSDVIEWQLALPIVAILVAMSIGFFVIGNLLQTGISILQSIFAPSFKVGGQDLSMMDLQSGLKLFKAGRGVIRGDGD